MHTSQIEIRQKDGYVTNLYYYSQTQADRDKPYATLLLLHGMAEHHERYHWFAKKMNELGIDIYLYSHRGHGMDTPTESLGFFHTKNGYARVINDAINIADYIRKNNKADKFFLFGHSMGSIIARNVLQMDDQFDGAVICGTTNPNKLVSYIGLTLVSIEKRLKGFGHRSVFFDKLLFGSSNYTKLNEKSNYDWLTRDEAIVNDYINDPYSGFICTTGFYQDLLKLTIHATRTDYLSMTRKDLPLYFISGAKDPVSNYGKEILSLVHLYKDLGYTDLSYKLYDEGRHELLNELNREQVVQELIDWMHKV